MDGLKYVLMGMGCMGLLILGSCSFVMYRTAEAVEAAADKSAETFEQFETTLNEQAEQERDEDLFGQAPRDHEDTANQDER
jgi:hypothetical protein